MEKPTILVTGSTGKTGGYVVNQLIDKNFPVRAFVHRIDERSEKLKAFGAEVVVGDFLDLQSVRAAMQGIKRVYFVYPPQGDRLVEATSNVAVAARDAGVQALVNMSQISAREKAESPLARQHWLSEQILDWANIGASHIRPTFFAEDLYLFSGRSIAGEGKLVLPYGDGKHAPIAAEDIARVVVGILANPEGHIGQRYVLTGPKDMTMPKVAEVLGKELDKPVEYINPPIAEWQRVLLEKVGFPKFLVTHLAAVAQDHQDGVFSAETDAVEKIGGRPPQSLEEFVRAHIAEFSGGSELEQQSKRERRGGMQR